MNIISHYLNLVEDTIRTFKVVFIDNGSISRSDTFSQFIKSILIADNYEIPCRLVNFLRYSFRFSSAYLVVALTTHRLLIVMSPALARKQSAWLTILFVLSISFLLNIWTFFLFELRDGKYCDVNITHKNEYFVITIVYIFIVMIFPIFFIFISNSLIINKLSQIKKEKKSFRLIELTGNSINVMDKHKKNDSQVVSLNGNHELKSIPYTESLSQTYYFISGNKLKRVSEYNDASKKMTRLLVRISFSYALFNSPYLIVWLIYFYETAIKQTASEDVKNFLFSVLQICEVIYVLNFCLNFYIYLASNSVFRNQLNYLGNFS